MPLAPSPTLQRLADGLLRWRGASWLGAKDVYVWYFAPDRVGVAFVGPALRLQKNLGEAHFNNRGYALDVDLQRAVGLPGEMRRAGFDSRPHIVMQTMSEGDVVIPELLEGVEQVVSAALVEAGELDEAKAYVHATMIPEPGTPWSPQNNPTPFYSAKKRRMFLTEQPPWLIKILVDRQDGKGEREHFGANLCMILPQLKSCRGDIAGDLDGHVVLVTHCMHPGAASAHAAEEEAKLIAECGGMLLPSLAVGPVPATIFGPLVLVASVEMALLGMKPYRTGRGAWPVVAYGADAWTVGLNETMKHGALALFEELTGHREFRGHEHFWSLGAPVSEHFGPFGGMGTDIKPLTNTKALATTLRRRGKRWPRELTQKQFKKLKEERSMTPDYYPYVEAKVNGVLHLDCIPVAVVPQVRYKAYGAFLKAAGFRGDLLVIDEPEAHVKSMEGTGTLDQSDEVAWSYAWRARDAVLQYALDRKLTTEIQIA